MIKDITFGKYYPSDSFIHRLDPRTKLVLLVSVLVFIFLSFNFISLAFTAIFAIIIIASTKVPFKVYLKNLKVILPILIFTLLINLFYSSDANSAVLLQFWIFKITLGSVSRAIFMSVRVILLILVSSVLTYTTTPNDLTDGLEALFSPLKFIGLGSAVHTLSMMMTIALRFIPTLVDETDKIMNAQKARGADFENGKLKDRVKAIVPILIPLLISAVRRAYDLAEAMESRCYNGGVGRKRMKQLKFSYLDLVGLVITLIYCAGVLIINSLF
ncbi:MAG: energy-coupling factor transporter transmembrane protein EcfT [Clostridiales bacterium]|nr:energy-coupling factor transporter transmembrane protein EcfT [Candidatus Equinaster intestinalis]